MLSLCVTHLFPDLCQDLRLTQPRQAFIVGDDSSQGPRLGQEAPAQVGCGSDEGSGEAGMA